MKASYQKITILDSHTEGEPTRLVLDGFPDLGEGSLKERLSLLKSKYDHLRKAVILEPRGNDFLVGALLCKPVNSQATAGVIFFNNSGYLGMCGHATIGLMVSLGYLGRAGEGRHLIETPVGDVMTTIHADGSVSVENVYSYRYRKDIVVDVPGLGEITGDIAWGGNWFFLVTSKIEGVHSQNIKQLTETALSIKKALDKQNITAEGGVEVDHIELFTEHDQADSKSFVLCPGGAYDRSPCGTGTSAKLACLAEDGELAEGEIWTQMSIIESTFEASYRQQDKDGIIPTIRGTAFICGAGELLLNDDDPFRYGIEV